MMRTVTQFHVSVEQWLDLAVAVEQPRVEAPVGESTPVMQDYEEPDEVLWYVPMRSENKDEYVSPFEPHYCVVPRIPK